MSAPSQTLLSRLAIAVSVFALLGVALVASSDDSGGSGGAEAASIAPVPVSLTEFAISPASIVVPKGGSIQVTNDGTVVHNVAVTGTPVKSTDIAAGGSETVDLSSLSPGSYELFCAIPGHKDSGMTATLVIGDGSAASTAGAGGDQAAASSHGGMDMSQLGTLEPTDAMAKRINKQLEDSMDEGVQTFLATAERYAAGEIKTGNAPLEPTVLPDGTKRFNVTAAITDWEVSPGKVVKAWTYNGIVPGPWIKVDPGDKVEVVLRNNLPISTDIHFHGVSVPNDMDGVAPITQPYIRPLTSFTYKFTAPDRPELGMWHAHMHGETAVLNGLFAVFQVGETPLPTGRSFNTMDVPEDVKISQEIPMVLNDAGVIGLSLNGKAFPSTAPIVAKKGEYILIHFFNEGLVGHPMHLHRQSQLVVAKDGFALAEPYQMDTIWVSPGERYSVLVRADEEGTWAFHCHILNHAESDAGLIGMVTAMIVQ